MNYLLCAHRLVHGWQNDFMISTHKHTHDGDRPSPHYPSQDAPSSAHRAEAAPIAQARQIRPNDARSPHRHIRASWSKVSSTLGR
jgi:hypothetical protein